MPILLSDIPPHREIIELDKNIGLVFDIDDDNDFFVKFDKLLKDEKMPEAFDNIKKIISAERMSTDYQQIYQKL